MIKSMTGYGAGKYAENGRGFTVEIKSVNHKYNDLSVRLPRTLLSFEDPVRRALSAYISRGKTDVYINYECDEAGEAGVLFSVGLGDSLYNELKKIKERYGFADEIRISDIYRFPNVIQAVKTEIEVLDENSELWRVLEKALKIAVDGFINMREKEGASIKGDMLQKLSHIDGIVNQIELAAPAVASDYKEKLELRLKELISSLVDEQRIIFEAALFADKASIDEEITRLKSHTKQFRSILEENSAIGKKLDFLVQEMMRESNTIGSKSNSIEITNCILLLKSEIEKIREQVQNIE